MCGRASGICAWLQAGGICHPGWADQPGLVSGRSSALVGWKVVLTVLRLDKIKGYSCLPVMRGQEELWEVCVGLTGITAGFYCVTLVLALPHFAATDLGLSFWLEFAWLQHLGLPCLRNATRIKCFDLVMGASCKEPLWASPGAAPESLRPTPRSLCCLLGAADGKYKCEKVVYTATHQQNNNHRSGSDCWSNSKWPLLLWFPQTSRQERGARAQSLLQLTLAAEQPHTFHWALRLLKTN